LVRHRPAPVTAVLFENIEFMKDIDGECVMVSPPHAAELVIFVNLEPSILLPYCILLINDAPPLYIG
jgi:hypothetical protein